VLALVVTVPAGEVELASDALWALGVVAVEERAPEGDREVTATEDRFVELWTSLGDDAHAVRRAAEAFPARWRWHIVDVDEQVAHTWREHAVASWVTPDLVVVPSWIDVQPPGGTTVVRIDPGAAFGLGDHPSTVLALRALRSLWWSDATVLDVGCGSGVLAVAAALIGAPYVEAIDVSIAAVEATNANARRNGVDGRVVASARSIEDVDATFDVVLANILAPTLVELAPELRRVTAPAGVLVVSGVLDGAHDHVVDALAPMRVIERLTREGWAAVVLRH
jgi:ribosomal protein L11 methyltransferase